MALWINAYVDGILKDLTDIQIYLSVFQVTEEKAKQDLAPFDAITVKAIDLAMSVFDDHGKADRNVPKEDVRKAKENIITWMTRQDLASVYGTAVKRLILLAWEDKESRKELFDSFYKTIKFGTGGRRGKVGIGPNRINPYMVALTAQGHANYLLATYGPEACKNRGVIIGYDVRDFKQFFKPTMTSGRIKEYFDIITNKEYCSVLIDFNSKKLAFLAAEVYAANGIKAYVPTEARSTPWTSFVTRRLHGLLGTDRVVGDKRAVAGVVMSSSHNQPDNNGTKLYEEDGGQAPPYLAQEVVKAGEAVTEIEKYDKYKPEHKELLVELDKERLAKLDAEFYSNAVEIAKKLNPSKQSRSVIAFHAMNGTGDTALAEALKKDGYVEGETLLRAKNDTHDYRFITAYNNTPNPEVDQSFDAVITIGMEYDLYQIRAEGYEVIDVTKRGFVVKTSGLKEAERDKLKKELRRCQVGLTTDPDADRIGVALKKIETLPSGDIKVRWVTANDNDEAGILLFRYVIDKWLAAGELQKEDKIPFAVTTVVSNKLEEKIAKQYGVKTLRHPVGFKFTGEAVTFINNGTYGREEGHHEGIVERMMKKLGIKNDEALKKLEFILSFEEGEGGLIGGAGAADKDSAVIGLAIASLAKEISRNRTVYDYLMEIYKEFGYDKSYLEPNVLDGPEGNNMIGKIQESLQKDFEASSNEARNLKELAGIPIDWSKSRYYKKDYKTDVATEQEALEMIELSLGDYTVKDKNGKDVKLKDITVLFRPSGTEPKSKIWCYVGSEPLGKDASNEALEERMRIVNEWHRKILDAALIYAYRQTEAEYNGYNVRDLTPSLEAQLLRADFNTALSKKLGTYFPMMRDVKQYASEIGAGHMPFDEARAKIEKITEQFSKTEKENLIKISVGIELQEQMNSKVIKQNFIFTQAQLIFGEEKGKEVFDILMLINSNEYQEKAQLKAKVDYTARKLFGDVEGELFLAEVVSRVPKDIKQAKPATSYETPGRNAIRTEAENVFDTDEFIKEFLAKSENRALISEDIGKVDAGKLIYKIVQEYAQAVGKERSDLYPNEIALIENKLYDRILTTAKEIRLQSRISLQEATAAALREVGIEVTVDKKTGELKFKNPALAKAYKDRGWHDFGYLVERLYPELGLNLSKWAYNIAYSMTHFGELHAATAFGAYPLIPRTAVYASTGSHSQGLTLDIKLMKAPGIQQIPVFNGKGELVSYRYMLLKPGDWAFSIPGTVDIFTVQQGSNQFSDRSITITDRDSIKNIAQLLGISVEALSNPKLAEGLPAKGMPFIFYRNEKGETCVTVHPEYKGKVNEGWVLTYTKPYTPEFNGRKLNEFAETIFNPTKIAEYETSNVKRFIESPDFALSVVEHIVGKEAKTELSPIQFMAPEEFYLTMEKARKAFEAFEEARREDKPIKRVASFNTGRQGYTWGQPVITNFILELMGAKTEAAKIELAAKFGIPEKEVIGELLIGAGAVDMGTGYYLPPQILGETEITAKVLTSARPLSVQIHEFPEMIIALEDGYAYMGLSRNLTEEEFIEALKKGDETIFNKIEVKKGQVIIVPVGMPHAYGVVRVYEVKAVNAAQDKAGTISFYDRLGKAGTPQELIERGLVRPGKDVLTLPEARVKEIARKIYDYGYLEKADLQKTLFTPVSAVSSELQTGKSDFEIMGINEGFVSERYTISESGFIEADKLIQRVEHSLFVTEGSVEIRDEKGKKIDEIKQGEELTMPASAGRYMLVALGGPAVVYTQYKPLETEQVVIAGFEAIKANLAKIQNTKVTLAITAKAFRGDGPGSYIYERKALNQASNGMVDLVQVHDIKDLESLIGSAKGIVVVQLTQDELKQLTDKPEYAKIAQLLNMTRVMALPRVDIIEKKGIPFVREIEAAGVILGNTSEDDIANKTAIAGWLRELMIRLTGNRAIDWKMLGVLLKTPDPSMPFNERVRILIKELLITMPARAYEVDKELRGRRELLWAV